MAADLAFCARYPFSSAAKEHVAQRGLELSSSYAEKAESRVNEALRTGRLRRIAEMASAYEDELVIYAASRMIVSAAANRYLTSRYTLAEAKRAGEYLASDDSPRPDYVSQVSEELGVQFAPEGGRFSVPLAAYLSFTPRSVDYKLSNREVQGGRVMVSRHERIRMLEEAVRKRIEGSLPIRAQFSQEIQDAAKRVLLLLPKLEASTVRLGQENYPPCIRKLVEDLALNVNVPHTGRVALAIYLANAGLADEKIVELFRHAPDFSERTTRYQVEHIRARKYRMPSCSTMDSYGICVAECRCANPLNFRSEIHGRRLKREEGESKHAAD